MVSHIGKGMASYHRCETLLIVMLVISNFDDIRTERLRHELSNYKIVWLRNRPIPESLGIYIRDQLPPG